MRFSRKDQGSERALSIALEEARQVPAPELDWDALETKLERAVRQPPPAISRRPQVFAWALLPAAAAALALLFLPPKSQPAAPAAPVTQAAAERDAERDGDRLSAEELLIARGDPVRVVHAGRAHWTLEENSRALVLDHGDSVRVRLVAGAMKASVVPNAKPERFVVEAAGTRVAVHGTVFKVQIQGQRTVVDVEQGVVSVGPRERPERVTALLRAPAHGEFTLEGTALSSAGPTRVAARRSRVALVPRVTTSTPSAAPAPSESPPEVPEAPEAPAGNARHSLTIGEAESGVAIAVEATIRCFEQHTERSGDVQVKAQTELTLDVSETGVVTEVSFTPPLSPLVQECAKAEALAVRFAPSSEGARITRTLELTR